MSMRGGVVAAVIFGMSCAAKPATSSGSRTSFCSSAYPGSMTNGVPMQLSVSFQLDDDFDAELRELMTHELLDDLNAHSSDGTIFVLADGVASTLSIELFTIWDSTNDHSGLLVTVRGPENLQTGGPTVILFTFSQDPLFETGAAMVDDAAAKVDDYIAHGWTCDEHDTATSSGLS